MKAMNITSTQRHWQVVNEREISICSLILDVASNKQLSLLADQLVSACEVVVWFWKGLVLQSLLLQS